jgi:hypothetical protein
MVEFLARLAHRRRVDQRHERRRVRHHHGEEQRLVARQQVHQEQVFLQVAVEHIQLRVGTRHLDRERVRHRGKQALDAERTALLVGERTAAVDVRVSQKRHASLGRMGVDHE